MAMDEAQAKAQRIRRELLPAVKAVSDASGFEGEANLMCTRFGTVELTLTSRAGNKMMPLFTADEIADDSYRSLFAPRMEKLLATAER